MVAIERPRPASAARPLTPDKRSPSLPPHPITPEEAQQWIADHLHLVERDDGHFGLGELAMFTGYSGVRLRYGRISGPMFQAASLVKGVGVSGSGKVSFTPEAFKAAAEAVGYSDEAWQKREGLLAEVRARTRRETQQNIAERKALHERLRGQFTLPDEEAVVLADAILTVWDSDRGRSLRNAGTLIDYEHHWKEARMALMILGDIHSVPVDVSRMCNSFQEHLRALVANRAEFLKQNTLVRELLGLFINFASSTQLLRTKVDSLILTPYQESVRAKVRGLEDFSLPFHTF